MREPTDHDLLQWARVAHQDPGLLLPWQRAALARRLNVSTDTASLRQAALEYARNRQAAPPDPGWLLDGLSGPRGGTPGWDSDYGVQAREKKQ